ncbi:MAG: VOC family protein [Phycisphaerales bacterium]
MGGTLGYDGGLTCALQVADLGKAMAWYQEVLGFEPLYRMDEMAWAEMRSPVARVHLGLSQVESPEVKGGATLTWGVTDIDATRATLEAKDVRFDGETMTIPGMVSLATFFDPDGNKHMLFQALSEDFS